MDIATANESTDIVGTAPAVVTLLLDFLARLQRLPLTLQTPRLRILPTDTLNQVTLNQDLSVLCQLLAYDWYTDKSITDIGPIISRFL